MRQFFPHYHDGFCSNEQTAGNYFRRKGLFKDEECKDDGEHYAELVNRSAP